MSKPREFWIDGLNQVWLYPQPETKTQVFFEQSPNCNHVIEYLAYETVCKERDKLRAELKIAVEALDRVSTGTTDGCGSYFHEEHNLEDVMDLTRQALAKIRGEK